VTAWADANAAGIALLIVMGVIGILALVGALFIDRLVEPRHEREFRHLASVERAREQRRREVDDRAHQERIRAAADLILANSWQGPEGTR
jgi:Flp pilus assembly protein TadB